MKEIIPNDGNPNVEWTYLSFFWEMTKSWNIQYLFHPPLKLRDLGRCVCVVHEFSNFSLKSSKGSLLSCRKKNCQSGGGTKPSISTYLLSPGATSWSVSVVPIIQKLLICLNFWFTVFKLQGTRVSIKRNGRKGFRQPATCPLKRLCSLNFYL